MKDNKPFRSRILHVSLAVDKKKGGTVVSRHNAASASPAPEDSQASNGNSARRNSTTSHASAQDTSEWNAETARTKRERTLAVLNLPDTVNTARLETFLSAHGPLKKTVMKPNRRGAIIEFETLADAGKVGMGIDCSALGPETRIGTTAELFARNDKEAAPAASANGAPAPSQGQKPVMRPAQAGVSRPAQRGGRRGGLGSKRGGFGGSGAAATASGAGNEAEKTDGSFKSNADFRNMFVKSGEKAGGNSNGSAESGGAA